MRRNSFLFILVLGIFWWASCSPKVQEPATPPPPPPVTVELDPNGCNMFNMLSPGDADRVSDNYNIYRDRIKEKNFKAAYPLWKDVYTNAPKTNGRIDYVFRDGLKIYDAFIEATTDETLKSKYVDTMMMIYDKAVICFPDKKSYYLSKKGYDLFYTYKGRSSDEEIYQMLKMSVEADEKEARVSTIIPLSSLNYRLYGDDKITREDALKTLESVNSIVDYNSKNCEEKECDAWRQVEQYTVELADRFENKKGFYDCDFFLDKYYADYEAQPDNCEVIEDLYRKLQRAGCAKENAKMVTLLTTYKDKCQEPTVTPILAQAAGDLESGNYQGAADKYEEYANSLSDNNRKAIFLLRVAKIYYAHLNSFSKARQYAQKAMDADPSSGAPLMLIGKLYASSGPLCGPGTGFDSQVVTWVAIDKWNEAKRKDPSVSATANKLISQYQKYMPSKADIFSRPDIKEGGSYTVKCWIQEKTTVRAAK